MRMSGVCVALLLAGTASGCSVTGNMQRSSAVFTGCSPDKNVISNINVSTVTWNATCEGKKYLCSGDHDPVSCVPAVD
jgi:hypothetical protein